MGYPKKLIMVVQSGYAKLSSLVVTPYVSEKGCFANDIEQFWRKIHDRPGVKNCKLFEGASPSFCDLARFIVNPKIAYRSEQNRLFSKS
jgi:hypothetical protein